MNQDKFNSLLTNYLQKHISLYILDSENQHQPLKEGKLINVIIKTPYLTLKLEYKEKTRDFHFPLPFNYYFEQDNLILDYSLKNISKKNPLLLDKVLNLPHDDENILYNTQIYITEKT